MTKKESQEHAKAYGIKMYAMGKRDGKRELKEAFIELFGIGEVIDKAIEDQGDQAWRQEEN